MSDKKELTVIPHISSRPGHLWGTKVKISAALRGNQNAKGYKHTPETRAKIAAGLRGENNGKWKGGRKMSHGYVLLLRPHHPACDSMGYVYEHRLVLEAHMGRVLLSTEEVHHINGVTDDNRIENLMLFDSTASHQKHHNDKKRAERKT